MNRRKKWEGKKTNASANALLSSLFKNWTINCQFSNYIFKNENENDYKWSETLTSHRMISVFVYYGIFNTLYSSNNVFNPETLNNDFSIHSIYSHRI